MMRCKQYEKINSTALKLAMQRENGKTSQYFNFCDDTYHYYCDGHAIAIVPNDQAFVYMSGRAVTASLPETYDVTGYSVWANAENNGWSQEWNGECRKSPDGKLEVVPFSYKNKTVYANKAQIEKWWGKLDNLTIIPTGSIKPIYIYERDYHRPLGMILPLNPSTVEKWFNK